MSSTFQAKHTLAKLVPVCCQRKKSHLTSELKASRLAASLTVCMEICVITEAQVSQGFKREEYNSARATDATSAAE